MALDPSVFGGAKLKVTRAKGCIDELQSELATFTEGGFYAIHVQPHEGIKRIGIVPAKPIPDIFALIIGDAVHNLRAALDHLATATSRVGGGKGRDLFFPFHKERKNLVTDRAKLDPIELALAGSKKLIIDTIQPYSDGNGRDLYALHCLDRIDKHNDLIVTVTGILIGQLIVRTGAGGRSTFKDCMFNSQQPTYFLAVPDGEVTVEHDFKASLEIRFGQDIPFGKESVIPTLVQLSQRVAETIELFVALCA